jgi:hypothetical protein
MKNFFNCHLIFVKIGETIKKKTKDLIIMKTVLKVILRSLLYSSIVILINLILVAFITGGFNKIIYNLSFLMLFEGGVCLVVGGVAASYSPIGARLNEMIFHSKPWNAKRQREAESQAKRWILIGIILIVVALSLSAL